MDIEFGTVDLDADGNPVAQTIRVLNTAQLSEPEMMCRILADPRNVAPPGLSRQFRQHWHRGRLVRVDILFSAKALDMETEP